MSRQISEDLYSEIRSILSDYANYQGDRTNYESDPVIRGALNISVGRIREVTKRLDNAPALPDSEED